MGGSFGDMEPQADFAHPSHFCEHFQVCVCARARAFVHVNMCADMLVYFVDAVVHGNAGMSRCVIYLPAC